MNLKILQLNIEGDKHIANVIDLLKKENPDFACFQEAYQENWLGVLKDFGYQEFFTPTVKMGSLTQGLLFLSKFPVESKIHHRYDFSANQDRDLTENSRDLASQGGARSKDRFNRFFIVAEYSVRIQNTVLQIATTHFPVADHFMPGLPPGYLYNTDNLRDIIFTSEHFDKFIKIIKKIPAPLIFTADLNNPRGKYIYDALAHELEDLVPIEVDSSLDPSHRANHLKIVVDTVMKKGNLHINNFKVIEGVSDHKAFLCTLELENENA